MAALTYARRQKLPKSIFAFPGKAPKPGSYPLDTRNRAINALSRISQFGTPEEKKKLRRKVYRLYPTLKKVENAVKR